MYHVNQANFTGIANMDLGDAAGDALFDLRIPLQQYECMMQGGQSRWPSQCSNPEEFDPPTGTYSCR